MSSEKTAGEVFGEWAEDERAERMWRQHLPRMEQVWPLMSASSGNYLEVGCGCGLGLRHVAENQYAAGHCVGIDISPEMVRLARKNTAGLSNVSVEEADFLEWQPAAGTRFDAIFSMEVFYYFPDIQQGLDKAFSLLAPGGRLWVLVDCYYENTDSHKWSEMINVPMQLWSKEQYISGFGKAGMADISQLELENQGDDVHGSNPTLCTYGTRAKKI